jgi:hypothetical protein
VIRVSGLLSSSTAQSRSALEKQGISYKQGRLSVKTDRAAPTHEEYIQKTQRSWEEGAKMLAANADAFAFGKREDGARGASGSGMISPGVQGQSSATPYVHFLTRVIRVAGDGLAEHGGSAGCKTAGGGLGIMTAVGQ